MKTTLFKLISTLILITTILNLSYANVSASVDRTQIEKGETFDLVLHLDNFDTKPNLDVLNKDFTIYNTSTSSTTTIINGKKSSKFDMIVTLMPKKTGKLIIPAIKVGNQQTQPINIEVSKVSNDEEHNYQDLFAIGSLSKNETYVNVPILYTLRLYYSTPILNLQLKSFNIKSSTIMQTSSRKSYQKFIHGKKYDVVEESFLIIPNTTGNIEIPSIVLEASIPNGFGSFGSHIKYFSTEPQTLKVKPIPDNISINDWFPASDVQISDKWSKDTDIKEGELLTRTITIKAKGILSNDIPKIDFKSSDEFNVYPEKPELKNTYQNGQLIGIATYKIGYMPIKPGKVTTPEINIKWFDLNNNESKIARISAKDFNVQKSNMPIANFSSNNEQPQPQIIQKVIPDTFWRNVAIFLFVLWLITLALLIKCILFKKDKQNIKDTTTIDKKRKNSATLKDIKKACSSRNNKELQKAIIDWANSKSDKHIFSLMEVTEIYPHLTNILKELNSAIYSGNNFNKYYELLKLINNTSKKSKDKSDKLIKNLYD